MKKLVKFVILIGLLCFLSWSYIYNRGINSVLDENGQNMVFVINKGDRVKKIAENLKESNLIDSSLFFLLYTKKNEIDSSLQAGEYILSPKMTIEEIASILSRGDAIMQEKEIKILEGWSILDIDNYFRENGIFSGSEFKKISGASLDNWSFTFPQPEFLIDAPKGATLEGYLFPDTYRIFENSNSESIIKRMLNNFDSKLTEEMRADIKAQNKTIYEIVTMASLLEKEVRSYEDKRMVAGLFWNRIDNGQALESCATLAYILGVNKKQYTYEDTRIESPYNTYQNRGLPPGPISNPGLDSIKASIYPIDNDYNYFLSSFDTGETIFSKTYEEHLRNKAKHLK